MTYIQDYCHVFSDINFPGTKCEPLCHLLLEQLTALILNNTRESVRTKKA